MKRSKELQNFVDDFTKKNFGKSLTDSQKERVCVICHKPITGFKDELSRREYEISGMCQECQDKIFEEEQMRKKAVIIFEEDGKNISTEINSELDTIQLIGLLEQLKFTLLINEVSKSKTL